MRTRTAQILYGYWNSVRAERFAPRRFEIEPARISELLPETFILERAELADLRYRLAGTRICEQFAIEFRGRSFFESWGAEDRATIADCTHRIVGEGAVGLLSIEAMTQRGHVAAFEILLLPLTHTRDSVDRVLGAMTAINDEAWLGHEPLVTRRLTNHEIIWPQGRPHAVAKNFERPALQRQALERQALERQTPFPPHIRHARIVRSDRRQFRVYEGGLSRDDHD